VDDLQKRRLKASAGAVGDIFAQSNSIGGKTHSMLEEMYRIGLPRESSRHMSIPISVVTACAVQLHALNVVARDAVDLVDQVAKFGPDLPYWFEDDIEPKSDRIHHVEQALRTLRGSVVEVVDVLIEGDAEFPGCAPDGVVTPKLVEIHRRSREIAVAIVRFLIEFIYLSITDPSTGDLPPAG